MARMIDFNDAGPQQGLDEMKARLELRLEALVNAWLAGLMHRYGPDEYEAQDFRRAFLETCADAFDRQMRWGPACSLRAREEEGGIDVI
jgi:hypothetical protein